MISAGTLDSLGMQDTPRKKNTFGQTNIDLQLSDKASEAYMQNMYKQQKWNNWYNLGVDAMNGAKQIVGSTFKYLLMDKQLSNVAKGMEYNYLLGSQMIEFRTTDSNNKKEVALAQLQTQENIARTMKSQNVAVAKINDSGRTDRTRIYAALSAARRGYSKGLPFSTFGA